MLLTASQTGNASLETSCFYEGFFYESTFYQSGFYDESCGSGGAAGGDGNTGPAGVKLKGVNIGIGQ